jgi:hypothetical protein
VSWTAALILAGARPVRWPADAPLRLHLVIDTEESFDWSGPFRRDGHDLGALAALPELVRRLGRSRVVPTCVATWPVVASAIGRAVLGGLLSDGAIGLGAHLHPWVTPPHREALGPCASYAGNLDPALEAAKLEALTGAIGEAFGRAPRIYKAGRYGLGPATAATLDRLGYRIDLSTYPGRDFGLDGGPDYRGAPDRPFRFGPGARLLGLPMSSGHLGVLAGWPAAVRRLDRPALARLGLGGPLARAGLLERVTLTPEGFTVAEQRRLVRALVRRGHRVLCLSLHSPSLAPGNTPYAPDAAACSALFDRIEAILELVLDELGGRPTTPEELLALAAAAEPDAP